MKNNPFDLTGKLALITGGGTGLGFGITKAFLEAGAKVIITGRREKILINACEKLSENVNYIVNDITDLKTIPALIEEIETEFNSIEILVNNAGINIKKHVLDQSDKEFERIIQTNLVSQFTLAREVGRKMNSRKRGSIINITSMAAIYGIPKITAYSASKTGLLGLTRALAADLSPIGIRVNAIAPGFIESPMTKKAFETDPKRLEKVLSRTPMNKLGTPEDVAYAAVYLASDAAKYVTGINLPIDGGNSIGF